MSRKRRNEPEVIVFEEPASSSRGRKRGREAARERERFLVRILCLVWTQDPSDQKSLDLDYNVWYMHNVIYPYL